MRVIGRKLLVYPTQIENAVNLPDQMIRRYHLVEIKPVEELTLSALSPPHHRPLPANRSAEPRNHGPTAVSTRVLEHYPGEADIAFVAQGHQSVLIDPKRTSANPPASDVGGASSPSTRHACIDTISNPRHEAHEGLSHTSMAKQKKGNG